MEANLHTTQSFDQELKKLISKLRSMTGLVKKQLQAALELTFKPEPGRAKQIIQNDAEINNLEKKIYASVMKIIALRHPVAVDLRQVLAAQRLAGELERIGDYAKNIARRSELAHGAQHLPVVPSSIKSMFKTVLEMINEIEFDYNKIAVDKLVAIYKRDSEIDENYNSLFRELVSYMIENPASVSACAQLLFVGRSLERVGDLIGSMAENLYFTITGEDLDQVTDVD